MNHILLPQTTNKNYFEIGHRHKHKAKIVLLGKKVGEYLLNFEAGKDFLKDAKSTNIKKKMIKQDLSALKTCVHQKTVRN